MPRTKYRPRKSKYNSSDVRFWINRYSWNCKHRRPSYDGIPEAMHQPLRDFHRDRSRANEARRTEKARAVANAQQDLPGLMEELTTLRMDRGLPAPVLAKPAPGLSTGTAAWLAIAASVLLAVGFTAATADVSRRSAERLSHRIAQLESRLP